jgi:hypothetical protein
MPKGGARSGAGRKPGVATKIDNELRKRALADGAEMPLEYMLKVMRDGRCTDARRDHMAVQAAPYIHAKLANVQHTGPGGGNIIVQVMRYAGTAIATDVNGGAAIVGPDDPPAE